MNHTPLSLRMSIPVISVLIFWLQVAAAPTGKTYIRTERIAGADFAFTPNPLIAAMVDSVSEEELRASIEALTGFTTRHAVSDTVSDTLGIGAARRWIHGKFQEFADRGLQPLYFDFDEEICGVTGQHRNVLAILPGTTPESSDRYFIVLGHMDSRTVALCDSESPAPGANDNGSGTAAAIELARVMSSFDFDATVVFSAVTGEEQGLFGSTAYAEYASQVGLRIDGVINNDMLANIEDVEGSLDSTSVRSYSAGPSTSTSRQLARYMKLKAEQYVPGMTVNLIPAQDRPGRSGDHVPFNRQGYAAQRFIETNENLGRQHDTTDVIGNMNFPYFARNVQINVAGLASLALAPETPTGLVVRDVGNGTDLHLSWPVTNTEPDFAGYRVAVRDADSLFYDMIIDVGDTTEQTLSGLDEGEAVYISHSAVDGDGNESIFSSEVYAVPRILPQPPSHLESTSRPDSIHLNWSPNSELDLKGYNIYRSTTSGSGYQLIDSVLAPDTSWVDTTVQPLVMYFYVVTAVDEGDQESPLSSEVKGRLATHDQGIIIVDATLDGSGMPLQPTDEKVDAFYEGVLSAFEVTAGWDRADSLTAGVHVMDADLGIYSTVVWHTDRLNGTSFHDTLELRKYLDAGGDLLLIGWNLAKSMSGDLGLFHEFSDGTFMHDYVRVDSVRTTPTSNQDFNGALGLVPGYPDLEIDTLKVTLFDGNLYNMDKLLPPFVDEPVTEAIYGYNSSEGGSPNQDMPVALRHLGDEQKIVVFDFPLFFVDSLSALGAIEQAMSDLGEEAVGVRDEGSGLVTGLPVTYSLNQNYPNPFNPETSITYSLTHPGEVSLIIYNVHGQKVRKLIDGWGEAGRHTVHWDGKDDSGGRVASGIYFYRIKTDGFTQSRKMVLVK